MKASSANALLIFDIWWHYVGSYFAVIGGQGQDDCKIIINKYVSFKSVLFLLKIKSVSKEDKKGRMLCTVWMEIKVKLTKAKAKNKGKERGKMIS
jgi:hypothetical protein